MSIFGGFVFLFLLFFGKIPFQVANERIWLFAGVHSVGTSLKVSLIWALKNEIKSQAFSNTKFRKPYVYELDT